MTFGTPSHPISHSASNRQTSLSFENLCLASEAGLSPSLELPLPSFTDLFQRIHERNKTPTTKNGGEELASARQQIETLSALLQQSQSAQRIEQEKFNRLKTEHEQLANYAAEFRTKVQELERSLEQRKNSESHRGRVSASQDDQQKEQQINNMKTELFNLGHVIADLQTKLSVSDSALQFNMQRSSGLETQCNRLTQRIAELENQLSENNFALQSIAASMQKAWEAKAVVQANLNQATLQLEAAAETHALQLHTIKQLQVKVASLQKENQRLKTNPGPAPTHAVYHEGMIIDRALPK